MKACRSGSLPLTHCRYGSVLDQHCDDLFEKHRRRSKAESWCFSIHLLSPERDSTRTLAADSLFPEQPPWPKHRTALAPVMATERDRLPEADLRQQFADAFPHAVSGELLGGRPTDAPPDKCYAVTRERPEWDRQ